MIKIGDKTIHLTRGDSCIINLSIEDQSGIPYEPLPTDTIIFTVKPDINNDYYVIRKIFNNQQIKLPKEDTINLNFGEYFYDVRLEGHNANYDTILDSGTFIIEGGTANARN